MNTWQLVALVIGAYLLGGVPFGLIIAKRLRGIDIREHGSGNIGATNVYRVLGVGPAILVFALDVMKGALPAFLAMGLARSQTWAVIVGVGAVLGHSLSPFLGFRGGKSVATGFGLLLGAAPPVAGTGLALFLAVYLLTRYVSLASVVAVAGVAVSIFVFPHDVAAAIIVAVACGLIVLRHRSNIGRLLRGEEPRTGGSRG